ncbi:Putative rRNA methylase [Thermosyntropha lipolytica DSM 11003]|uniref:Putative rRNA methylase n=1 Tax=Thermosyntropha lipolytica DSM 11003 TaxID=1123382 RepID=A0A1M5LHR2_9FIRM|nr:class I SAM-dependent methyltransferase [Thermosyntropha lipolytica]SHG64682.1 Putative rRNA methylase [Thermosyntropha lipolytica DSM 11003]
MFKMPLKSAVNISHLVVSGVVKEGDTVIDATCGRGHDTLFLARLVGEKGKVLAFDIQEEAIESTYALLKSHQMEKRVILIKEDHARMKDHVQEEVKACMFNLGYLPGGDHAVKTEGEKSLRAVKAALDLLSPGGVITVVGYPGHEGGEEEVFLIRDYLISLPQQRFEVWETRFINQVNKPPCIMVIQKL